MSVRSLIFGLLGAVFIAAGGFVNNEVWKLAHIEEGGLLPVIVVGTIFVAMVAVNPLLFRLGRKLALRPGEVATMVLMLLVACNIPGRRLRIAGLDEASDRWGSQRGDPVEAVDGGGMLVWLGES